MSDSTTKTSLAGSVDAIAELLSLAREHSLLPSAVEVHGLRLEFAGVRASDVKRKDSATVELTESLLERFGGERYRQFAKAAAEDAQNLDE